MHDLLTRIVSPMGGPNLETLSRAVARKVVLVTGASFGIGEASARKLGAAGATVVLLARSAERLETLAHEIRSRGGVQEALRGRSSIKRPSECVTAPTSQT
jgi:NADP-dependent 3-hydroxy acid dehydrogenase YdfG